MANRFCDPFDNFFFYCSAPLLSFYVTFSLWVDAKMECDNRWWAAVRIDGGLCGEMHREFESWYSQLKEKFHFTEKCQVVYFNYDTVIIYLMVGWPGLEELQNQTIFSTLQKGHENNVTFWRMTQMVQGDTVKRVTYWVTWALSWT